MAKISIYDLTFLSCLVCLINRKHVTAAILTPLRNLEEMLVMLKAGIKMLYYSITHSSKGKRNLLYQFKLLDITSICGVNTA